MSSTRTVSPPNIRFDNYISHLKLDSYFVQTKLKFSPVTVFSLCAMVRTVQAANSVLERGKEKNLKVIKDGNELWEFKTLWLSLHVTLMVVMDSVSVFV